MSGAIAFVSWLDGVLDVERWHVQALPRGHPDCLTGKTFVITGSLESLTRSDAEDLIKRHSGRVTGSVSGKTTFLVAGQDSGTRKVATVSAHFVGCYTVQKTLMG